MSDKPAPTQATPQQQGVRPESVSGQRYLKGIIAGTISNKFSGSHPETMAVSRITHHIYSSVLGWVEPVMIRSVSEQYEVVKLSDTDEKHLKGCFRRAIARELDPTWDSENIAPLVLEIYTAITKAFCLEKRPVFDAPETEAESTPIDFEAIDSLLDVRRNHLDKKLIEGLAEAETIELRRINDVLDGLETEYHRPAMADLKRIEAFVAKQPKTEAESVS